MRATWLLLVAISCNAQKLHVYSEFTRIDPRGEVVAVDKGAPPRHILSPGFPRNAYSSLRVVVELDKPGDYHLDIAQNPENAVRVTLYKERFEPNGTAWLPDKLEVVKVPYIGTAGDFKIPGQKVVTFWLDMWVDRGAEVDRIKVEPQLWVASIDDWITYPMEVRILAPVAPDVKPSSATLPDLTARSDAAVFGPMRQTLCSMKEAPGPNQVNGRALIRRNARQHLAMITSAASMKAQLTKVAGAPDPCGVELPSGGTGPEWYLKFKDSLFRSLTRE